MCLLSGQYTRFLPLLSMRAFSITLIDLPSETKTISGYSATCTTHSPTTTSHYVCSGKQAWRTAYSLYPRLGTAFYWAARVLTPSLSPRETRRGDRVITQMHTKKLNLSWKTCFTIYKSIQTVSYWLINIINMYKWLRPYEF